MDWYEILLPIIGVILGVVLTWIGANYLKTQAARYRAWKLTNTAQEVVLWIQDYYPNWAGAEKLKKAIELIIQKMDEAGWDDVPPPEAEVAARVAYQKEIGIQKTMLEKAKELEAKFKTENKGDDSN